MKFEKLLSYADEHGLDYVVTGHYARIEYDEERGRYLLKKAVYSDKDQSYVLYMLTQEQLSRICFPLGGLQKSEVREIAESIGFRNARKHDSQDICFVPDGDYASFIEKYTGKTQQEGSFLNVDGERIGTHKGAIRYTTGQRKGLGIALGEPAYVISKDMANNTVTLGREEYLFSDTVYVNDLNWISVPDLTEPMRVKAKIRYRQQEQPATISPAEDGKVMIKFDAPQRAATAGQAAVFYDGDIVVGGGCICGVGDTNA